MTWCQTSRIGSGGAAIGREARDSLLILPSGWLRLVPNMKPEQPRNPSLKKASCKLDSSQGNRIPGTHPAHPDSISNMICVPEPVSDWHGTLVMTYCWPTHSLANRHPQAPTLQKRTGHVPGVRIVNACARGGPDVGYQARKACMAFIATGILRCNAFYQRREGGKCKMCMLRVWPGALWCMGFQNGSSCARTFPQRKTLVGSPSSAAGGY